MYCQGKGVPEDVQEAVEVVSQGSIEQGHARAQSILAIMYHKGEGVLGGRPGGGERGSGWQPSRGTPGLNSSWASCTGEGEGVPEDDQEAAELVSQGRRAGSSPGAQLSLGYMSDKGEGVPEDDREAVKWYRKAAEQGDAGAQFILGHDDVPQGRGSAMNGLTARR